MNWKEEKNLEVIYNVIMYALVDYFKGCCLLACCLWFKVFFYSLRTKISLPTFRAGGRIKPLHRYSLDYILLLSLCLLFTLSKGQMIFVLIVCLFSWKLMGVFVWGGGAFLNTICTNST